MGNYAVIAEFNPFHSGHKKLIESIKDSADNVVCVMSGHFVQSVMPAVCDKSIRSECAVLSGADAVIELPAVYATASAKSFAEGSLKIISKIKNITNLAFGASSDKNCLLRLAEIKIKHADKFSSSLKKHLNSGKSFNFASRAAFTELYGAEYGEADVSSVLDDPNSILGIEYICAIDKYAANIQPDIITRKGSHLSGEYYSGEFLSATNIRKKLLDNCGESVNRYIPYNYEKMQNYVKNHAFDTDSFKKTALFAIKSMEREEVASLRDCVEGMEFLIKEIAKKSNYDNIVNSEQLKIYGAKKVSRLLFDAALAIKKEYLDLPFVTRLLSCKKDFDFSILPDFVKSTNRDIKTAEDSDKQVKSVLRVDERAAALYNTLCGVDGDYYNYSLVKA